MTEAEWLAATEPKALLRFVVRGRQASDRRFRNADEITPVPTGICFTMVKGRTMLSMPGEAGVSP